MNTSEAAKQLGSLGGKKTAQRGPDYFREIAAKRKNRRGRFSKKNPK